MTADGSREVWFTDRHGAEIESDITLEHLGRLLATTAVADGDDEHRSISVSDQDEWDLEFYPDSVLFDNLESW